MQTPNGDNNRAFPNRHPALGFVAAAFTLAALLTLCQAAQAQSYSVLYALSGQDGGNPAAGLTLDSTGNLYGTTVNGGANGYGTVFEVDPTGPVQKTLYSFAGQSDGSGPASRVVFGPLGNLYGTTTSGLGGDCGGAGGCGTVYSLTITSQPCQTFCDWAYNLVWTFGGGVNGTDPYGDLAVDPSTGDVYGTTRYGGANQNCGTTTGSTTLLGCGIAYEVTPSGKYMWSESKLYDFGSGADGKEPYGGVIADSADNLYGTAFEGGSNGYGRVFQLKPGSQWTENVIYNFAQGNGDGRFPFAGVFADSSLDLYGITADGASGGNGAAFELVNNNNGTWGFQSLYNLSGTTGNVDGARGNLVTDGHGNFYGTQQYGGADGYGYVFKLSCTSSCTLQDIHDFIGTDGAVPYGTLALRVNGGHTYLYGTTYGGGNSGNGCTTGTTYNGQNPIGCGVVFQIEF